MSTPLHSISYRNEQFLFSEGLTPVNVMEYFYQSPFYSESGGARSVNEMVRRGSVQAANVSRLEGDVFHLVDMNEEARMQPTPPVDGSIYLIQKFRQQGQGRSKINGPVFYVISGTVYAAPGLGQLIERHFANSVKELEGMVDAVQRACTLEGRGSL